MKSLSYLLISFFLFTMFTIQAQDEQQQEGKQKIATDQVEVYYFHNTRRCATCEAIEEVTKASLNEFYPEQVKSGTVIFKSLNIEEEANEDLAKQLKIFGQTLLVVKNGKKKDLTNDAFMYARSKPDKLKEKIHKAIGTI